MLTKPTSVNHNLRQFPLEQRSRQIAGLAAVGLVLIQMAMPRKEALDQGLVEQIIVHLIRKLHLLLKA